MLIKFTLGAVDDRGSNKDAADRFGGVFAFGRSDIAGELADGIEVDASTLTFDDHRCPLSVNAIDVDRASTRLVFCHSGLNVLLDQCRLVENALAEIVFAAGHVAIVLVCEGICRDLAQAGKADIDAFGGRVAATLEVKVAINTRHVVGAAGWLLVDRLVTGGVVDEESSIWFADDEALACWQCALGASVVVDGTAPNDRADMPVIEIVLEKRSNRVSLWLCSGGQGHTSCWLDGFLGVLSEPYSGPRMDAQLRCPRVSRSAGGHPLASQLSRERLILTGSYDVVALPHRVTLIR